MLGIRHILATSSAADESSWWLTAAWPSLDSCAIQHRAILPGRTTHGSAPWRLLYFSWGGGDRRPLESSVSWVFSVTACWPTNNLVSSARSQRVIWEPASAVESCVGYSQQMPVLAVAVATPPPPSKWLIRGPNVFPCSMYMGCHNSEERALAPVSPALGVREVPVRVQTASTMPESAPLALQNTYLTGIPRGRPQQFFIRLKLYCLGSKWLNGHQISEML